MSGIVRVLLFMASCVLAQNIVFTRLPGCGVEEERGVRDAVVYGVAVALATAMTAAGAWMVRHFVVEPLNAGYVELVACALVALIAAWIAEKALGKWLNEGENSLGIAANCALLGIALINQEAGYDLGRATLSGLAAGLGFLLAVVLLAGVRERLEGSKIPEAMKGLPITLASASLIALAFMGFIGL